MSLLLLDVCHILVLVVDDCHDIIKPLSFSFFVYELISLIVIFSHRIKIALQKFNNQGFILFYLVDALNYIQEKGNTQIY